MEEAFEKRGGWLDTGANLKLVVDQSSEKDTMRIYCNGELVTRPYLDYLKGHARNGQILADAGHSTYLGQESDFGDTHYGIWNSAGDALVYIDNFKAYLVDEFVVEDVDGYSDVFNTAKSAVTYTFSKPVNANVVANEDVVLLDAEGNTVAGGIASITLSDANYKMAVKLSDTLPGLTNYSVKLTETLTDVDGLPLSTKWKKYIYPIADYYEEVSENVYSVTNLSGTATHNVYYTPATGSDPAYVALDANGKNKAAIDTYVRDADAMMMYVDLRTSKATSLFATAGQATVNGDNVSVSIVFTNPEIVPMSVWCVVAAYGERNKMLGCVPVSVTEVDASSSTEVIPVNFTVNGSEIKTVRMFVWNNYEDMKPYQKVEEIFNK